MSNGKKTARLDTTPQENEPEHEQCDPLRAEREVHEIRRVVLRLQTAVLGDSSAGNIGLVKRIEAAEAQGRHNEHEIAVERNHVNLKLAWLGGIGTAIGTIIGFLTALWEGRGR